MQHTLIKLQRDIRMLKWITGTVTLLLIVTVGYALNLKNSTYFKEITVQRINVVEGNGKTRMVISNKDLSPEVLSHGKGFIPPIPGHNRPGLIFYNDEGTENGGLVFMGHTDSNGKYSATGHLSFDQYNQNQVLYLQYADENGQQNTGLHVDDWQDKPPFWQFRVKYKSAQKLKKVNKYTLKLNLEQYADGSTEPARTVELNFDNHDEIFGIIESLTAKDPFNDPQQAAQFALGLKLFSEVMLKNRQHQIFKELSGAFPDFMKRLKSL
jgi:hypothetical protein